MKKAIILSLVFIAGCSSEPKKTETVSEDLPKAVPVQQHEATVYRGGAAPTAIEAAPAPKAPIAAGASCETPLGTIPDGGKATGYLKDVVGPDEICISDTLTCKNGKWSGQAIHPSCRKEKSK